MVSKKTLLENKPLLIQLPGLGQHLQADVFHSQAGFLTSNTTIVEAATKPQTFVNPAEMKSSLKACKLLEKYLCKALEVHHEKQMSGKGRLVKSSRQGSVPGLSYRANNIVVL